MNSTEATHIQRLEDYNNEQINRFIAPLVFLFILLVIGVPGNLTVIFIYGQKYSKSVYRSIIWNLAVVDLIVCAVGIPFNIARIFKYYLFSGRWECKTFTGLLIFGIMYSSHLLLLLSIHRFRQICLPLTKQISLQNVHIYLIACACLGVLLSWPQAVVIEIDYVKLNDNNITLIGQVCPITAQNPSVYSVAYSIVSLCILIFYTVVLFIIYSFIGRKLYLQRRRRLRNYTTENNQNISDKVTKIAFTISVVFAISYVPLFFLKVSKEWFNENDLGGFAFSVLKVTERFYLVNHVANPFIYAMFDNRFRRNFKLIASFKWRFKKERSNDQSTSQTTTTMS